MTDAFDADVLIYAARPEYALGRRIAALFQPDAEGATAGIGSVLLVPEILTKPMRVGATQERDALVWLLARLELFGLDRPTANLAVSLGAKYGLRAPDAVHLATAASNGADRFITNNRRDFDKSIAEIEIVFPDQLPQV